MTSRVHGTIQFHTKKIFSETSHVDAILYLVSESCAEQNVDLLALGVHGAPCTRLVRHNSARQGHSTFALLDTQRIRRDPAR